MCYFLSGCTVNRYYYVAEEPIELYEFASFSGEPVLVASIGDTVSTTGTKHIQLGGAIPVEYAGYRFYSPSARARFIRTVRVNSKKSAMLPGIIYASRQHKSNSQGENLPTNQGYTPTTSAPIQTGPRGGQYYINSHGNKTYVPRSGGRSKH